MCYFAIEKSNIYFKMHIFFSPLISCNEYLLAI